MDWQGIAAFALASLSDFAGGRGDLTAEQLQAVVRELWAGNTEYNAELSLLQSVPKPPPLPMALALAKPEPFAHVTLPTFTPGPARAVPRPVNPQPPPVKSPRPGWVE